MKSDHSQAIEIGQCCQNLSEDLGGKVRPNEK